MKKHTTSVKKKTPLTLLPTAAETPRVGEGRRTEAEVAARDKLRDSAIADLAKAAEVYDANHFDPLYEMHGAIEEHEKEIVRAIGLIGLVRNDPDRCNDHDLVDALGEAQTILASLRLSLRYTVKGKLQEAGVLPSDAAYVALVAAERA